MANRPYRGSPAAVGRLSFYPKVILLWLDSPNHTVRHIGLFHKRYVFRCQLDRYGRHQVLQMRKLRGADNRYRYRFFLHKPGKGDLRPWNAIFFRNAHKPVNHQPVGLLGSAILHLGNLIRFKPHGRFCEITRQPSRRQRAVGRKGNLLRLAKGNHLPLFLAVD